MSFFSKLESFSKNAFTHPPAWEIQVLSAVKGSAIPTIELLDTLVDPALAAEVNPVLDRIKTGFAALSVTVKDSGASPNIASILGSIQGNLASLEAVGGIKNSTNQGKIAAAVAILKAEADSIAANAPKPNAPAPTSEFPIAS